MKKYRISTDLLRGIKEEDKENFKERLIHNKDLLDRIVGVLRDKAHAANKKAAAELSYESPSWAYYQADKLGYNRALGEMIAILTLDREKTNE